MNIKTLMRMSSYFLSTLPKKIIWCIYDVKKKLQSSCSFDFDDADRLAPCCRWSLLISPSAAENVKKRGVCMIKKICRVRIILRGRYKCCPKAVMS